MDSAVAAALVHRAIGDRLTNVFVDNGLLRKDEFHHTMELLEQRVGLRVIGVNAAERFLARLAGVTDPEVKRKRIGAEFIAVFADEARRLGDVRFLVQGTLYPDVIESVSVRGPSATIKTHHNVGGLPPDLPFELVEPLRELFKDEVRRIGRDLGLPEEMLNKHPFPGPGLAVRLLGEVTPERLATLARCRRHRGAGNSARGLVREDLAGVCGAAAGAQRRRDGRRAKLRRYGGGASGEFRGRHDRGLGALAARSAGAHLDADRERSGGRHPRGLRHQLQAAQHDRVGITRSPGSISAAVHCASADGHLLRHVEQQAAVGLVDAAEQPAEVEQEAGFLAAGAEGDLVR